ncbi:MAG: 5-(carboxyamino)imidazole ribonucleotide mutase [Christensenellales bacterium]
MKKVAVIMGSASDLKVAGQAAEVLKTYGIPHVVRVASAHRTPEAVREFAVSAREKGYGVIIAVAGMAAHLAGAIAANTTLPVIGVPVASGGLGGLDALLATVQMPSGIPVATVAVNGAKNAAHLAAQMLAVEDEALAAKLHDSREQMARDAAQADREIAREYGEDL